MISKQGQLIKQDLMKWGKNTFLFLLPAIIMFLSAIQTGVPLKDALYLIYLWGLNVSIDLLKKLEGTTKY